MASLRDLIQNTAVTQNYKEQELAVWNTNTTTALNGGQCCCWVVPSGVTWARFEVWGGGGAGGGACCCMGPLYGPGNGQYGKRHITVTAGCSFLICAAGTGCCHTQCCGTCGFKSYVLCNTGGATVACAGGGLQGCVLCFRSYQGCVGHCYPGCVLVADVVGDVGIAGYNSTHKESQYCFQRMWSRDSGAPVLANNTRHGPDYCCTQNTRGGPDNISPKWPGGAGANARACGGGCCYGGFGAGGLVLITYG